MTVNPLNERAAELAVHEKAILFVRLVKRDPREGPDPQFHPRPGFYASLLSDDAYRGKRRSQKLQGVFPFMEGKYGLDRRVNQNASEEGRQRQFSFPARAAMPRSMPLKTNSCRGQTEYQ